MQIYLWLDDERIPPTKEQCNINWLWVKSVDAAIEQLKTGNVVFASLDHDLADEHYKAYQVAAINNTAMDYSQCKEKTGYDVLCWMEEHDVWPVDGVRIHTMNGPRKQTMLAVVQKAYGRTFQLQINGTHKV